MAMAKRDFSAQFNDASQAYCQATSSLRRERERSVSLLREVDYTLSTQGKRNEEAKTGNVVMGVGATVALIAGGPITAAVLGVGAAVNGLHNSSKDSSIQTAEAGKVESQLNSDLRCQKSFDAAASDFRKVCAAVMQEHPDGEEIMRLTKTALGRLPHGGLIVGSVSAYCAVNAGKDILVSGALWNGAASTGMLHCGFSVPLGQAAEFGRDIMVGLNVLDDVGSVAIAGSNIGRGSAAAASSVGGAGRAAAGAGNAGKSVAAASPWMMSLSAISAAYYTYDWATYDADHTSEFHTKVKEMVRNYDASLKELKKIDK